MKNLFKSWTLWFNAFSGLVAIAELNFQLLKPYVGDKWYGAAYFTLILVNAALRLRTEVKHQKSLINPGA